MLGVVVVPRVTFVALLYVVELRVVIYVVDFTLRLTHGFVTFVVPHAVTFVTRYTFTFTLCHVTLPLHTRDVGDWLNIYLR